jgi:hypothetical protein
VSNKAHTRVLSILDDRYGCGALLYIAHLGVVVVLDGHNIIYHGILVLFKYPGHFTPI